MSNDAASTMLQVMDSIMPMTPQVEPRQAFTASVVLVKPDSPRVIESVPTTQFHRS